MWRGLRNCGRRTRCQVMETGTDPHSPQHALEAKQLVGLPLHPIHSIGRYAMPFFVIGLTDVPDQLKAKLPKTDSRLRRDIGLLENGIYNKASRASSPSRY